MRINQYKAGVVLSYLTVFIGSAISIIYTPVMLRILGKSEYGLYQLVFSVVGYLGLLNFGFGSSYIRFYSRYKVKDDRDGMARINGMFLTVFLVISLITVAAGSVLVFNIRTVFKGGLTGAEINTAKTLMTLMILNIALSFPASVFSSIVAAHERYFYHRMLHLIKAILNPFLTLPLLLLGYKSVSLIIVTTLLTLVCFIIDLWYCFNKLGAKFKFKAFDFNLLKEIWVFSFFIFINMITDQLNWSIDKFILGKYTGTIGVAVYSIGAQLNSYYLSFSTSISSVFIPRVNSIVAQNKDNSLLTELFTRVGRIQFIVLSLLMGGFILIGEYFISFWAGSGYRVSYYVALLLMIPVTVPLIQSIGIEIQRAKNLHKFRSVVYLLLAVANLFISILLVKAYGEVGAAAGTGITLIIGNGFIMNWYYHKVVGLNIAFFWKEIIRIFPAILIAYLSGFLVKYAVGVDGIFKFLFVGLIYFIVFCCSMWYLGLNSYEKTLFSAPIKRLLHKK